MAKTPNTKQRCKRQIKLIIFDFLYTLYNPHTDSLFPGVKEMLIKLSRNYPLIIVSFTTDVQNRLSLIKKLGLFPYFKEILVSHKSTELFLKLCKKHNAKPQETIIIGDNPNNEIAIAKEIGAVPVLVSETKEEIYIGDIYVLPHIDRLPQLINKLET